MTDQPESVRDTLLRVCADAIVLDWYPDKTADNIVFELHKAGYEIVKAEAKG